MLKITHFLSELLQSQKMIAFKEGVNALVCIGILIRNSLEVVALTDAGELEIDF